LTRPGTTQNQEIKMAKKSVVRKSAVTRKTASKKTATKRPKRTPQALAKAAARALEKARKQFGAAQVQADKIVVRARRALESAQAKADKYSDAA